MTNVDYQKLKPVIINSCEKCGSKYINDFKINLEKINQNLANLNLMCLPVGLDAHRVEPEDVFYISEYFVGENLKWFTDSKFITTIICVDLDDVNEELEKMIEDLNAADQDNPDLDKTHILADIVSKYHCYFAMIVSYASNDPGRAGKNTYYINCRANKVVVRDPNYVYNNKDMA